MNQAAINKIIYKIAFASYLNQEGHIGSSLSILDILLVLYNKILKNHPNFHSNIKRDYFILSKGHASLAHAAVLNYNKYISDKQFFSYTKFNSILGGHLDRLKVPGVEFSCGSLGHGISVAIGIALSKKIKKEKNRIYVLVGDGEINEGSFWESLLLAAHHKLDNLYCIVDYNRSNDRALKLDSLFDKFKSFNWHVKQIDGHDHKSILKIKDTKTKKPKIFIAHTIKGKGIKFMENNPEWHHKFPNRNEISIIKDLLL